MHTNFCIFFFSYAIKNDLIINMDINNNISVLYKELSDKINTISDRQNSTDSFFINGLDKKLTKILAIYLGKNKENMKSYLLNLQNIRLESYFPFYFNDIPNFLLINLTAKGNIDQPLSVDIDEKIEVLANKKPGIDEYVNFSFRTIMNSKILPYTITGCKYDYDLAAITLSFSYYKSFSIPEKGFHFYINYNNETDCSLLLHHILSSNSKTKICLKYDSGKEKIIDANLNWDNNFAVLSKNLNLKLKLTYPELFLYCNISYSCNSKADFENIKSFNLYLEAPLNINDYNLKNIFHLNLIPTINIEDSFAQTIKFTERKETYPIIHPDNSNFSLFYIKEVYYETDNNIRGINHILYDDSDSGTHSNFPCYTIEPATTDFNQMATQIKFNLPLEVLNKVIEVNATWLQPCLLEKRTAILNFSNKQKGFYELSIFKYFRYRKNIKKQIKSRISKALKLLRIKNQVTMSVEDIILLAEFLGFDSKHFNAINKNLKSIYLIKKNEVLFYEFNFEIADNYTQSTCNWFCNVLIEFITSNSSIDNKIKYSCIYHEI
jgi:hypothetical protein